MDPENVPNSNDTDDTSSAKPSFEIDDDDDWSRQVQTDETTAGHHDDSFRMMTSVVESDAEEAVPQPQRELTLKEKLVMRERERRIETKRARLKRQFALNHEDTPVAAESSAPESVAETEESIVAHPDEEESAEEARRLGFNMERFLRNSDSFNPQLEPTTEEGDGVLMERFLNEPVQRADVTRSVSFDMEGAGRPTVTVEAEAHVPVSNLASFGEEDGGTSVEANTSVVVEPDDTVDASNLQDESSDINSSSYPATDEPRVLRLTEADMQEMAAIEDASIGNAPPSEREEMLSEIGELADFGGGHPNPAGNLSLDTPTTAMESNSVGNQSATRNDHRSLDGLVNASVSSHPSPGGSVNDTVEANPPSERATPSVTLPDEEDVAVHADLDNVQQPVLESNDMLPENSARGVASLDEAPASPLVTDDAYQSLAAGDWSPAGAMGVSPLHPRSRVSQPVISNSSDYGTLETRSPRLPLLPVAPGSKGKGESEPLLSDVPPEIITRREHSNDTDGGLCPSIRPSVDSIFRDARSEERGERAAMRLESEKYAASSILKRGASLKSSCFCVLRTHVLIMVDSLTCLFRLSFPMKPCLIDLLFLRSR